MTDSRDTSGLDACRVLQDNRYSEDLLRNTLDTIAGAVESGKWSSWLHAPLDELDTKSQEECTTHELQVDLAALPAAASGGDGGVGVARLRPDLTIMRKQAQQPNGNDDGDDSKPDEERGSDIAPMDAMCARECIS